MSTKYVYKFEEGNAQMRELLGGKGANLAEMTGLGMPVPEGFTVTTEACTRYYEDGRKLADDIMDEIMDNVRQLEERSGLKFGDPEKPLLVSVRSGARASMPGMMDTILNLGLNDDVVKAMIAGNPDPKFERFVYDSYRRFIQMFSDVVMEVGKKYFEQLIDKMKAEKGVTFDVELTADDGRKLKFFFVGTIEYKGKNYSAFEPAEEMEGMNEDDLVIFEVSGDDEETAELLPIEDDALLDEVFQEFCRVLEEDEMAEEAESLEPTENNQEIKNN